MSRVELRMFALALLSASSLAAVTPSLHARILGETRALGENLARALPRPQPAESAARQAAAVEVAPVAVAMEPESAAAPHKTRKQPPRKQEAPKPVKPADVFVPASTVRRWGAAHAAPPAAALVPPQGARPGGLRLAGVGRFGVGARDGDVLTHVGGRAVSDPGQVVSTVLGAYARGDRTITGRVYRGEQSYTVTVEFPRSTGKTK